MPDSLQYSYFTIPVARKPQYSPWFSWPPATPVPVPTLHTFYLQNLRSHRSVLPAISYPGVSPRKIPPPSSKLPYPPWFKNCGPAWIFWGYHTHAQVGLPKGPLHQGRMAPFHRAPGGRVGTHPGPVHTIRNVNLSWNVFDFAVFGNANNPPGTIRFHRVERGLFNLFLPGSNFKLVE